MAEPKKFFDVWFVQGNSVYKEVPYHAVVDWVQQARLGADDMIKPSGTANWFKLGNLPLFQEYLPQPETQKVGDAAEALEPIELDFNWKRRHDDDDDDVDMIPLIDISLVLLIFFMMTATVASISRIAVPGMVNASKIDTSRGALRVDIDMSSGTPVYAVGLDTAAPLDEDANLKDEVQLFAQFDKHLQNIQVLPKVRIAAHGELPYDVVEKIMNGLDRRRQQGVIAEYHIEVGEKAKQ